MTKRVKRLDLIDRVPEELWMEVHDIVQETGIKTIPKKNKCKNPHGSLLQIAVKRRVAKSKGEKEIYTHMNAEFQRKQGEKATKPSSAISAKKYGKTIKWKRLEITSKK